MKSPPVDHWKFASTAAPRRALPPFARVGRGGRPTGDAALPHSRRKKRRLRNVQRPPFHECVPRWSNRSCRQDSLLSGCAALLLVAGSIASMSARSARANDGPVGQKPRMTVQKIEAALRKQTSLDVDKVPLHEVLKRLSVQHEIDIRIDEKGLKQAGVSADAPITLSINNVPLTEVLSQVLDGLKLHYIVDVADASLLVTAALPGARVPKRAPAAKAIAAPGNAAIVVNLAGAPLPNAAAFQRRFEAEFKWMLMIELRLLRAVCQPGKEQLAQLQNDSEKLLEMAAKEHVERLGMQPGDKRRGADPPDPRKLVVDSLRAFVEREYPAETVERYRHELAERAQFERQACARMLVAMVDQEVLLSAAQRKALYEALAESHDMQKFLALYPVDADAAPRISERLLAKVLDPAQLRVWRDLPGRDREILWDQAVRIMGFPNNDLAEDVPPKSGPLRPGKERR